MKRAALGLVLFGALAGLPALAQAKPKVPRTRHDAKRAVPDYGALPQHEPARAALVLPKVVLTPPYLVWNYAIRKPLGALVSTAEKNQWPTAVLDFFTFGPERNAGIVPTALFDFGIKPSVGVFAFWNKFLHPDNSANFHFGFWGPKWLNVTASDRLRIGTESFLVLSGRFTRRPDMPFYGIGSRTLVQQRVRYTSNIKEIGIGTDLVPTSNPQAARLNEGADAPPARLVRVLTRVGVRAADFSEGRHQGDVEGDGADPRNNHDMGLLSAVSQGRVQLPPGFARGYVAPFQRLDVQLDTRSRRPASQTGIKVVGEVEYGSDVRSSNGSAWLRYGGTAGAFWDVSRNRTLGVTFTGLFVDPLRGDVPFSELVTFGGGTYMRGFLWNRLMGRSGAVATLQYNWPIWIFLDGIVQASVGNVFDAHLKDFSPKLLRFSGALGLRTSNTPNQAFEALIGIGSETIADGFALNSLRVVLGTSQF